MEVRYGVGVAPSAYPLLICPCMLQRGLTHVTGDWAALGYACVKDHMHFHFLLLAASQARKPGQLNLSRPSENPLLCWQPVGVKVWI